MSARVPVEPEVVDSEEFIDFLDYGLEGDNSTVERKCQFLAAYRETGVLYRAALRARIHRTTVYKWLDKDPAFATALQDCHEDTYDDLEACGLEKAKAGDPILTMFYLKAHRPKFRDRVTLDINAMRNEIQSRLHKRVITDSDSGQLPMPTTSLALPAKKSED